MNGYVCKSDRTNEQDMEKINAYTRRKYLPDEVYTFSVILCDNEVDRDFECFTVEALGKLSKLFVGKTGITDHDHSSRNQYARIYSTELIEVPGKFTQRGEAYCQLSAKAYIPKNRETESLIESIESGIRKEVSVGCAVGSRRCSICGEERCTHVRGRRYGGELCVHILEEPTDAYEFSFVAVPAQRAAGVTKKYTMQNEHMGKEDITMENVMKALEAENECITLSGEALIRLKKEIGTLKEKADWGERYREALCVQILKNGALAQPQLGRGILGEIVKKLSVSELEELSEVFSKIAKQHFPITPQLAVENGEKRACDDGAFKI